MTNDPRKSEKVRTEADGRQAREALRASEARDGDAATPPARHHTLPLHALTLSPRATSGRR